MLLFHFQGFVFKARIARALHVALISAEGGGGKLAALARTLPPLALMSIPLTSPFNNFPEARCGKAMCLAVL